MKDRLAICSSSIRAFRGLCTLKPLDTTTPEGRSRERLRRVTLTAVTSVIGRAVSMAAPLITVPLTLHYLGPERYGLWMTVAAVVSMCTFADLGLGNGLMNAVSQADGRNDSTAIRRSIASALLILSGVAAILLGVSALIYPFVPWARVFNATSTVLGPESGLLATVCFVTFLANLPLGVVQRVQCGLQEGFQSNLWQCAGGVVNVVAVVAAVKAHASLPLLVLCVTAVQPVVAVLNGCIFFRLQRPHLRPRLVDFDWTTAKRLLGVGFWFFIVSLLAAAGVYSDNLVVAQVLGLGAVPLYSIPARLVSLLGALPSMIYTPLWTANGEALARGDFQWVRRNAYRFIGLNFIIGAVAGLGCVVAGPPFLHRWIGPNFTPGVGVFAALSAWSLVTSIAGPLFMVLNGASQVRVQVKMFALFTPISVLLKVVLAQAMGVSGVVCGSVAAYALIIIPLLVVTVRRVLAPRGNPSSLSRGQGEVADPARESRQTDIRPAASGSRT